MENVFLSTPLLTGVKSSHFFNGRLLTAEDLKTEQEAVRMRLGLLGQALGEGVVTGLEVGAGAPSGGRITSVQIRPGLAVNGEGQVLRLDEPVQLTLTPDPVAVPGAGGGGVFQQCGSAGQAPVIGSANIYLLLLVPAEGRKDHAPKSELGSDGRITGCDSRFETSGVKFQTRALDPRSLPGAPAAVLTALLQSAAAATPALYELSKLRNLTAYLCFGFGGIQGFAEDPLIEDAGISPFLEYGVKDHLRKAGLLDACEVPLALVYWGPAGIRFLDMWPVRRMVTASPVTTEWPLLVGRRRRDEAEAWFLQFQDHLDFLLEKAGGSSGSIKAEDFFLYLPPGGFLPLEDMDGMSEEEQRLFRVGVPGANAPAYDALRRRKLLAKSLGQPVAGFTKGEFFGSFQAQEYLIDEAFLRYLADDSFLLEPIDLSRGEPALAIYYPSRDPGYLFFLRQGDIQPFRQEAPPVIETPEPETTGDFLIRAKYKGNLVEEFQDRISKIVTIGPSGKSNLKAFVARELDIWAEDAAERRFEASLLEDPRSSIDQRPGLDADGAISLAFSIQDLVPGEYSVFLQGAHVARLSQGKTIRAGETTTVTFNIEPKSTASGGKVELPPAYVPPFVEENWIGKYVILGKELAWNVPGKRPPVVDPLWDPVPDGVMGWMKDWGERFSRENPKAPIDFGDLRFYMRDGHLPGSVEEEAYAYVAFGENGAYAPLLLVPNNRVQEGSLPAGKGGVMGVDIHVESRLRESGIAEVDVLGAAYTGLLVKVLGVSGQTAGNLIADADGKAKDLQGSLLVLNGVGAALSGRLSGALGNLDPTAVGLTGLANAKAEDLFAALGPEAGVTLEFVKGLVQDARAMLPLSAWSLDVGGIGLTAADAGRLKGAGIESLGQFRTKAAMPGEAPKIATLLGTGTGAVEEVGRKSGEALSRFKAGKKAATPATEIAGVTGAVASNLAKEGFTTVASVATASPAKMATFFGGNFAAANAAIANAANFLIS